MEHRRRGNRLRVAVAVAALALLLVGGLCSWVWPRAADALWAADAALGLVISAGGVIGALRARRLGVDAVALLALVGTMALAEYFAAAVLSVMLATGAMLEARASQRAIRDLSLLATRAPTFARVVREGLVSRVPADEVAIDDELVLAAGDIVPVDGVLTAPGLFDESAVTGESVPVRRGAGEPVASGVVCLDTKVPMRATGTAASSTYATIVALTERAQATNAPFVRMADRWALLFVPATALLAWAGWALGGAERAVSVMVVATPCPLILAAPIALLSGLARCARAGVIVKDGRALEQMAATRVLLIDKTGTLTEGRPRVTSVQSISDAPAGNGEVLATAAALEQYSTHVLAPTVVREARNRGLAVPEAVDIVETPGKGVCGTVGGVQVRVGAAHWAVSPGSDGAVGRWRAAAERESASLITVSRDGAPVGALFLKDPLRRGLAQTVGRLRGLGITRTVLITGDHPGTAHHVARIAGIDEVRCEVTPAEKLDIAAQERQFGPTMMVGDGINDAPALAGADVGVALAARGASAASQAADVVLVHDRVDALSEALGIAQSAVTVARQSVVLGMALSLAAMAVATAGGLRPAGGAVLQEGIDLLSLLWALRAADRHARPWAQSAPPSPAVG